MSEETLVVSCVHPTPEWTPLALGLCVAYARKHLAGSRFDLGPRFVSNQAELDRLLERPGRHVLLFSDYMWTVAQNLELSRRAKAIAPGVLTVHGGPSVPAYPDACREFLRTHPHIDVAVHGEGEVTLVDILEHPDATGIAGTSRMIRGDLVAGPRRERVVSLEELPSPYLTGVFDAIDKTRWQAATMETNRGCPYGCTFCDWGSATLQKIRSFPLDRVLAEITTLAGIGIDTLWIADANFGILARDLDIAKAICRTKAETGSPHRVVVNYAKNTHQHLVEIVEAFVDAGLVSEGIISIQSRDPATLSAVRRKNIKTREYDRLKEAFANKGLPLATQLMLGLPGGTPESLDDDLRHYFDGAIRVDIFRTVVLPNSPMAEPAYRAAHRIVTDETGLLLSTATMSALDLERAATLTRVYRGVNGYGMLRYPILWLEWEHGKDAILVMRDLVTRLPDRRAAYPLLVRMLDEGGSPIDLFTTHMQFREELRSHGTWGDLHAEFSRWIAENYGISSRSDLDALLGLQTAIMPAAGRSFPAEVRLAHDVVRWYEENKRGVRKPLESYPASAIRVTDPWELSSDPVSRKPHRPVLAWELDTPLLAIRGGLARNAAA